MAVSFNLIAIPVAAGLMVGTAAAAIYVGASVSAPAEASVAAPVETAVTAPVAPPVAAPVEAAAAATKSCDAQTWPYLDAGCLSRAKPRTVRVVMAPRQDDTPGVIPHVPGPQASLAAPDALGSSSGLMSSDTVLHKPMAVTPTKTPKARAKRSERRAQSYARSYQVPSEARPGSGAMIVVRPLRVEQSW
jgi:hypothetical protein